MKAWLDLPGGKPFEILARCQIGRGRENDIVLTRDEVSRRHALICRDRTGFWLVDLDSRNGTLLNGVRIHQPERLLDGTSFTIGTHSFKFRLSAPEKPGKHPHEARSIRTRDANGPLHAPDANAALLLDTSGRLLSLSDKARQLLTEFFPDGVSTDGLPAPVKAWMNSPRAKARPLFVNRPPRRLVIRHGEAGTEHSLLMLTSEEEAFSLSKLKSLNLSEREAEVTRWMVAGKRNEEIAIILEISVRTVEKHVHNVLEKLGVENRTSVANTVLEKLSVLYH